MEIAKLVVAALTPLTVAMIGVLLAISTRRFEGGQWLNQKLTEKRIELLSEAMPKLNDLYCYFCWIGGWATFSPPDMLGHKRALDRLFYANQVFFSSDALLVYTNFIEVLFKTYAAPGVGARLRTSLTSHDGDRRTAYPNGWQAAWETAFADETEHPGTDLIKRRYRALVAQLGAEVGVAQPNGAANDRAVVL